MEPSVSEELEEARQDFNLGAMLAIALAAVVGTTLTVWCFHFINLNESAAPGPLKPLPRIAVLPFQSLGRAPDDILFDRTLTITLIAQLARISRVETLSDETDADPVAVGQKLGVQVMLIGKVERLPGRVRIGVQIISARDGRQIWAGSFEGDPHDLASLSARIDRTVALHLTALLD